MPAIFHPLLALIASATDRELAKYIQFLKEENKILRARVPVRYIPAGMNGNGWSNSERRWTVPISTFYRWLREEEEARDGNDR